MMLSKAESCWAVYNCSVLDMFPINRYSVQHPRFADTQFPSVISAVYFPGPVFTDFAKQPPPKVVLSRNLINTIILIMNCIVRETKKCSPSSYVYRFE